jgi:hypothetical protein
MVADLFLPHAFSFYCQLLKFIAGGYRRQDISRRCFQDSHEDPCRDNALPCFCVEDTMNWSCAPRKDKIAAGRVSDYGLELGTWLHKKEVWLAILYLYIICVLRSFQIPSNYVRWFDLVMIMIFRPSCRCIVLLMYKTLWKNRADVVNRERRNSQVLSKLQCLNDVISRSRCSSRATVFTYLPAGLQFEYVAGAQWFNDRIFARWLSDGNCRYRMEDRFSAVPEKKCACICVISFKEIPSAVFIDRHSSRAR